MVSFPNIGRLDYSDYWESRGFQLQNKLREREVIIRDLIQKGTTVLDIGCGNSRLPIELKAKGCSVAVADISSIVLDAFKKEGIDSVILDLDDISHAKGIGFYDYIVMSEVLEHTRNPEEILKSLSSHTKRFVLTIPNSGFYKFRLQMLSGHAIKQWVYHPSEHLRFWSHIDFVSWLQSLGYIVEYSAPSNGLASRKLPFVMHFWPNLFGHQMVYVCKVPDIG